MWHLLITIGSRMAEANNITKDFKAQQTLRKNLLYANWKTEINMWDAFTFFWEGKRAHAIFMALKGEVRKAILNMVTGKLTEKIGVNNLIAELDKMYDKVTLCW